jgi:hypothetical protein
MKSELKAPGTKRLKLTYEILLSIFAFNFTLRRYTSGGVPRCQAVRRRRPLRRRVPAALGRAMQVEPMEPILKAPGTGHLKLTYDTRLLSFAFNFNLRRYCLAWRDLAYWSLWRFPHLAVGTNITSNEY